MAGLVPKCIAGAELPSAAEGGQVSVELWALVQEQEGHRSPCTEMRPRQDTGRGGGIGKPRSLA